MKINPGEPAAGAIISDVYDLCAFLSFHMGDGMAGGERYLSNDSVRARASASTCARS